MSRTRHARPKRDDLDKRLTAACIKAARDANKQTGLVNENAALLIRAVNAEAEVKQLKAEVANRDTAGRLLVREHDALRAELARAAPAVALAEAVLAVDDASGVHEPTDDGPCAMCERLSDLHDQERAAIAAYRAARAGAAQKAVLS